MFKKIKTTLACCSALMMLCAVPLNANAAEEVKINDAASVAVGDTFTYSMYIADASKDVMGMQAYVFMIQITLKLTLILLILII